MVDIDIIEREILNLEKKDTTFATVERLAWLYTVRDHLAKNTAAEQVGTFTGSEFCECCSGVPLSSLMEIISEHMYAIKAVYPKEYDLIISKIKKLSPS